MRKLQRESEANRLMTANVAVVDMTDTLPESISKSQSSVLPKTKTTGHVHRVDNSLTVLSGSQSLNRCQTRDVDCWLLSKYQYSRISHTKEIFK